MAATASTTPTRLNPETDTLTFQCKDILTRDVFRARTTSSDTDSDAGGYASDDAPVRRPIDKLAGRVFQILLFGTTASGQSVCLQVDDFKPFFYVRIPDALVGHAEAIRALKRWVLNGVSAEVADSISFAVERHKTLWDYTGGAEATFLKLITASQGIWRALKDRFLSKTAEPKVQDTRALFGAAAIPLLAAAAATDSNDLAYCSEDCTTLALKIYEANIDPALRFFHIQDVSPAGWIQVAAGDWDVAEERDAKVQISAITDHTNVCAAAGGVAPFLIASWDIECTSSHGDFPLAKKTWRKPARELYETGLPTSFSVLCTRLAGAIRGDAAAAGGLSPVYLKRPMPTCLPETVQLLLETKGQQTAVANAIVALRSAVKGDARDAALGALEKALTTALPAIAGDEVIQIGTVLYRQGAAVSKHLWVLGTVDATVVKPPGADVPIHVQSFHEEGKLLAAWFRWIGQIDPDVLIGYNIFGFDSQYMWDRMEETIGKHEMRNAVAPLSCLKTRPPRLEEKFLSSSAMGDNTMYFMGSPGRLQIDLLPYIRRNHNLDSYTLDNVSATFVSGAITGAAGLVAVEGRPTQFRFATKSTKGIVVGRYLTLLDEENDRVVDRCGVVAVEPKALVVEIEGGAATLAEHGARPVRWAQVKDDVSPKDIFRLHRGSARDRAIVGKYCLQDCDLVMELFNKLEILNNSVAMADVCSVPVSYIFLRGQGIKIESLIFKECRKADQLIEVLPTAAAGGGADAASHGSGGDEEEEAEVEDTYEGAIVLEPHTGIYIDDPVTADDFASLYPSSIISENISHDTLIWVKDYDKEGRFVCIKEGSDRYDNLPGQSYVNIEFDILRPDPADTRKHPAKLRDGKRVARYIQTPQGTIPRILEMLLASRKKCRKLAETEPDEFRRALLDAQQLAYKLTANSLYGQLGSGTFKIRRQVLAASTTAYGRKQLMYAKAVIESVYGGGRDPRCDVECVYGDTDSIFLRFRPKDPATGARLSGKAALEAAKALTVESGKLVSSCLKPPHDFEFDKIFRTFCLLSKKRYVGDMSEDGVEDEDFHRKSMGIVMKRRDNAPIVKYVYGGVIDRILDPARTDVASGVREAAVFVQETARDLLGGKFPLSKLTITKSLRAEYADPTRIAHKVLADRIAERDPGNKPSTSDRIPFVYIQQRGGGPAPKLQGDRIETPAFIRENKLLPDYAFYITNQIAKPVAQVFGLAVEHMPGAPAAAIAAARSARDPVAERERVAESLLFETILRDAARTPAAMEARGQRSIATFFGGGGAAAAARK
jgi:DNA polymerase elongation subunit (family B)